MMNRPVDWTRKTVPILIVLTALMMAAGCGVKAPPIAPQQPSAPQQASMPQIDDLSGTRKDLMITLTWTHPAGYPAVVGYAVMQLKIDISEPQCPQCPQQFEQIGTLLVPATQIPGPVRLEFTQPLQSGFNYTFKVRPMQASGARGPDSNFVVVETGMIP